MTGRTTARLLGSLGWPLALGLAMVAVVLGSVAMLAPPEAHASGPVKTGYVVVRFGDHDSLVRVFTFTTPISSYVALQRAGLNPVAANTAWGLMLCGIAGVGKTNPAGNSCDNGAFFWLTYYWDQGSAPPSWQGYTVGVGDSVIAQDGHIDGYVWTNRWPGPQPPHGPGAVAAYKGLEWLRPRQDASTGGYGTPNDTLEVLLAVTANHYDADQWRRNPGSPSLRTAGIYAASISQRVDGAGKLATAMAAAEGCWPFIAKNIMAYYDSNTGRFDPNPGYQAWAIIGLRALSQTIPAKAVQALEAMQTGDGSWPYGSWSTTGDTNGTALAIQALIAAGKVPTSTAVTGGLNYLEDAQNADGGFPWDPQSSWGTDSDTNSTAYVVQAIVAAGEDPTAGRWLKDSNHPISYLVSMQLPGGAFEWQPGQGANQLATQQAIPALLYRPFPLVAAEIPPYCEGILFPAAYLPIVAK